MWYFHFLVSHFVYPSVMFYFLLQSEEYEDEMKCDDEDDGIDVENVENKSTKKPTSNINLESKGGEEDNVLKNALTIMEQVHIYQKRSVEAEDWFHLCQVYCNWN